MFRVHEQVRSLKKCFLPLRKKKRTSSVEANKGTEAFPQLSSVSMVREHSCIVVYLFQKIRSRVSSQVPWGALEVSKRGSSLRQKIR